MPIRSVVRRVAILGALIGPLSCEHTQPFSNPGYESTTPLQPGNPAQLTYNPGADVRPSWLPDGSAFLYTQEQTDITERDRCLVVMPKTGGGITRTICAADDFAHDTLNDLESAAVNTAARMAYVRTSMLAGIGRAGPDQAAMVLGSYGTPVPGTVLHALPYPSPSGQGVDMASDLNWVGPSALVYLGEQVNYPAVCAGCVTVDTVRSGVEIDRIDLNGTISVVVDTGFPTSASVVGGDTLYYTLTNSGTIHRRILSTAADTVVFDYGLPATDVSAVRGRLAVVVLGQLHVLSLSPFADQTLATPHPGQIIAHPALDPGGHLIVAEVSDSTALSNLWLWTVP